jgi:hypothetical protein
MALSSLIVKGSAVSIFISSNIFFLLCDHVHCVISMFE